MVVEREEVFDAIVYYCMLVGKPSKKPAARQCDI
jgi:hypothetical protein